MKRLRGDVAMMIGTPPASGGASPAACFTLRTGVASPFAGFRLFGCPRFLRFACVIPGGFPVPLFASVL
jgi:hypothetical protein